MALHVIVQDSISINGFGITGGQMRYEENAFLPPWCLAEALDKPDLALLIKLRRKHITDQARH